MNFPSGLECFDLNSVIILTTFAPQFYANVLGMTSIAKAKAFIGNYSMPSTVFAFSLNLQASSISIAPPPGTSLGFAIMFLATAKQSCKFLSISFKTSLEAPLNRIVQAFGFLHSTKNVK